MSEATQDSQTTPARNAREDALAPSHNRSTCDAEAEYRHVGSHDSWTAVYKRLKRRDEAMIDGYISDMDALLIFAGLFSAILTAFLVEVYPQLQGDSEGMSAQILSDISLQLFQISNGSLAPPTHINPSSFKPSNSTIALNTLWFLSLLLSLMTALLVILVKQWLREYMSWTSIHPVHDAVHLRQYRFESFVGWGVPTIVSALPVILQSALILFLGGLLALLLPLDRTAGITTTVVSCASLVAIIVSMFLPLKFSESPYKTPFGWALIRLKHRLIPAYQNFLSKVRLFASATGATIFGTIQNAKRCLSRSSHLPTPATQSGSTPTSPTNNYSSQGASSSRLAQPKVAVQGTSNANRGQLDTQQGHSLGVPLTTKQQQRPVEYKHDGWTHFDLDRSLSSLDYDPVHIAAWRCRALLWIATYDDLDPDALRECADDVFGPSRQRLQTFGEGDGLYKWPDDPHKRLCAYWLAISEHFGHPLRTPLPLFATVGDIEAERLSQEKEGDRISPTTQLLYRQLKAQLLDRNPLSREMIFHLLYSGFRASLDSGPLNPPAFPDAAPFREEDLKNIYVASLYMMRILCHRWSGLHSEFFLLLTRILSSSVAQTWTSSTCELYGTRISLYFLQDATEHIEVIEHNPRDVVAMATAATALCDIERFRSKTPECLLQREHFWAVANATMCLRASKATAEPYDSTVITFLRCVQDALRLETEPETRSERVPFRLGTRIVFFAAYHLSLVPPDLIPLLVKLDAKNIVAIDPTHALMRQWVNPEDVLKAGPSNTKELLRRARLL